jgi:hypothetical protein
VEVIMLESAYQAKLIKRLYKMFPDCLVLKNDTDYMQGIPDLTIFYRNQWAMLEVKASKDAPTQPNQPHYVEKARGMSFAAFIYPENEEEVLRELQRTFEQFDRHARVS